MTFWNLFPVYALTEFFIMVVLSQENPADLTGSYNVGPYKHVYPPVNVQVWISSPALQIQPAIRHVPSLWPC